MISVLPDELETEILSRVPAKSLGKLKTTCKRWYALFRDPKFVKKNFSKAASEVILLMKSAVYSISLNLYAIRNSVVPSTDFTAKLSTLDDSNFKISEIFHCAGLLLCAATNNSRLVVWNPCTGETRWINPRNCYRSDDFYALGYKNSNSSLHSYKILRFCRYYDYKKPLVFETEIFDFSSDSWRVVDDVTGNCCIECKSGVTLKGSAYWFASDEKDPMGKFILRFDFTTERFGRLRLPLPFQSDSYVDEIVALSVVGDDKLALLQQSVDYYMDSYKMTIWTTDTKLNEANEVSWVNLLIADFGNFKLPSVTSFLFDEEYQVAVCCDANMDDEDRTNIYIVGEDIHETIL